MQSIASLNTKKTEVQRDGDDEVTVRSGGNDAPDRADSRPWAKAFRPHLWPGYGLSPRPGLLLLNVLLLAGLAFAINKSGADNPRRSRIDLLAEHSSPKLNITSATAPMGRSASALTEPGPLGLAGQSTSEGPGSIVLAQGQSAQAVKVWDSAPVLPSEPVWDNGYANLNSHAGDGPMMRNWKLVGMQLVLASGLAAAPAMAADSDNPAKPPDNAALWKEIQDLKKNLGALDQGVQHTFRSFDDDFGKRIKKLEDESTAMSLKLEKSQSDLTRALTELDDLHRQLAALRQDLDRKSYYVPPSNGTAATRTNMGRVRLINTYYEPVTVLLNGRSYAIEPGETRFSDAMVPGTFTYEVLGIQPALTRTLAANETFTVTVHPQ